MTPWLTGLLTQILRPILTDLINDMKVDLLSEIAKQKQFEAFAREDDETIRLAQEATTTEEVKAHLRRLKSHRAILRN